VSRATARGAASGWATQTFVDWSTNTEQVKPQRQQQQHPISVSRGAPDDPLAPLARACTQQRLHATCTPPLTAA
jgi:hypothetical protein